ncbi:MAG: AAA family ATPase [Eggerthellaceae bacterium]|nr:AAA family ATPase [Eggerthellaceae bacterium]
MGTAPERASGPSGGQVRRAGSSFVRHIKIVGFGAFSNRVFGPFAPGMNVVFGKNESGKTTLNAFVSGVLFGWEDARGARNAYQSANAERAGSLFFKNEATEEELELSRAKDADGLQGCTGLVDDIDKETYAAIFGLTSDELTGLHRAADMTAKLLTAGSGTSASPAAALAKIQSGIAEYTSRASGSEHSIGELEQRQEELRAAIAEASDEAERFKLHDKELRDIAPQLDELAARLQAVSEEIESLAACRASLEKLEQQQGRVREQLDKVLDEAQEAQAQQERGKEAGRIGLAGLQPAQEYGLRDKIAALQEAGSKADQGISLAKEGYATSKAAYEALLANEGDQGKGRKAGGRRRTQVALSVALPLVFAAAGAFLFVFGGQAGLLPSNALGVSLVAFAAVLAIVAIVLLFRPNKAEDDRAKQRADAQAAMLQDKRKLDDLELERLTYEETVRSFLESEGLGGAYGSLKRARDMLDEAREARAEASLLDQKLQALAVRLSGLDETSAEISAQRAKAYAQQGLSPGMTLSAIDQMAAEKAQERRALIEVGESLSRRSGELAQELSQAKGTKRFDELKMAYQQVRTREKDSMQELARLLLAKRTLEVAVGAWEAESQPRVYRQASRLLALMTSGKWVKVSMSPEGKIQVADELKTVCEPRYLSLATCQQLYLSLRIALLLTAENVGRAIPVMADDILVNFDADRSGEAVKALLELAKKRQVIMFTCHPEMVSLMRSADPQVNVLEL